MKFYSLIFILTPIISFCMEKDLDNLLGPLEFSDESHREMLRQLKDAIAAEKGLPNIENNEALKIYKSIQSQLEKEHLNKWINREENKQTKNIYLELINFLLNTENTKLKIKAMQNTPDIIQNTSSLNKGLVNTVLKFDLIFQAMTIVEEKTPIRFTTRPQVGSLSYWSMIATNTVTNLLSSWTSNAKQNNKEDFEKKFKYKPLSPDDHLRVNQNLDASQYALHLISYFLCIFDILQRFPDQS